MPLDAKLQRRFEARLANIVLPDPAGPRLVGDADRLLAQCRLILLANPTLADPLHAGLLDDAALHTICLAVQLPLTVPQSKSVGKLGIIPLRERCEQSARLLVEDMGESFDETLLDRSVRILLEIPQKSPVPDEARLLADAINLEDFGTSGVLLQAVRLATTGLGIREVLQAFDQRERYGYWEARLHEGFHFKHSRHLAQQRLADARRFIASLRAE